MMNVHGGLAVDRRPAAFPRLAVLACLAGLAATQPARADGPSLLEETLACRSDVMQLCADKVPDREAIIACLKHNRARLSSRCGPVFDAGERAHAAGTDN